MSENNCFYDQKIIFPSWSISFLIQVTAPLKEACVDGSIKRKEMTLTGSWVGDRTTFSRVQQGIITAFLASIQWVDMCTSMQDFPEDLGIEPTFPLLPLNRQVRMLLIELSCEPESLSEKGESVREKFPLKGMRECDRNIQSIYGRGGKMILNLHLPLIEGKKLTKKFETGGKIVTRRM